MRPRYERFVAPPLWKHRVPAPWRDTTDILRLEYQHRALADLGLVYAFSANLSPEVEASARARSNPLNWLRDRIAYHLEAGLSRAIDCILVLEEDDHDRLHLHGELGVTESLSRNS
jgi:hypothetical protein